MPGAFTGADGLPGPNLYGFDGYPGGTCSTSGNPGTAGTPPDWGYFGAGGATGGATASPNTPGAMIEFGGGWFDPWGDKLFGGAGYPCLARRENGGYERDYYLTALANGIKIQNIYMTFGGTNWGWLPAPVVYTSYDYGAAWDEARQARVDKVAAMKAMGYMVQSVEPLSQLDKVGTVTASDTAVKVYHLANPDTGTHVYFPRHTAQSSSDLKFTFPISTADGDYTIPQSGQLELNGEDMKALLANYELRLPAPRLHDRRRDDPRRAARHRRARGPGPAGPDGGDRPALRERADGGRAGRRHDAPDGNGDLRIDYPIDGFAEVKIGGAHPLLLLIADDNAVATLWREETRPAR